MAKRGNLRSLRKLLRDPELENVREGVELALSLGDVGVYAKLLEGCRIDDEGRPVLGAVFHGSKKIQDNLLYAWVALVGGAKDGVVRHESLKAPTGLDLSDLRLPAWPDQTPAFGTLHTLKLARCWLDAVPAFVGELTELRRLVLDHNQLESLPGHLGNLENLETLEATHNRIRELDPAVCLATLRALDLRDNPIATLPKSLGEMKALRTLLLRNARLETLPPEIGRLESLRTFEATRSQLRRLPPDIGELGSLETLDLRDNEIAELPTSIADLEALETLELTNNHLTQLPAEIGQLPRLRRLRVSFNRLRRAPAALGAASGLRLIALASNPLGDPPESLGALAGLRQLDLSRCQLDRLELEGLSALRRLDVGHQEIGSLDVSPCPELEVLLAPSNQLREVAGLAQASRLEEIDLTNNQLTGLPARLGELAQLRSLRIGRNQLEALPPGAYPGLVELDASDNALQSLPPLAEHLSIHRFDLSGNPLRVVTAESLPRRVRELRLARCGLTILTGAMESLPLRVIDLRDNDLLTVPHAMLETKHLEEIDLRDNPLDDETRERLAVLSAVRVLL